MRVEGHAIVSADGMIADSTGHYPEALRNEADWAAYQAALDAAAIVVIGRRGHENHPNPGRRRLVVTRSVSLPTPDPADERALFWNPAHVPLADAARSFGIADGTIAVTGLFALFIASFDRFVLSEKHDLAIPAGTPCFVQGHPREVLASAGLRPARPVIIDHDAFVTTTVWTRPPTD